MSDWRTIPGFPEYRVNSNGRVMRNDYKLKTQNLIGQDVEIIIKGGEPYYVFRKGIKHVELFRDGEKHLIKLDDILNGLI